MGKQWRAEQWVIADDMITFIDESGKFTKADGWSVVAALTLTHHLARRARRQIELESRTWPRLNGELKGGALTEEQFGILCDILWKNQGLLHVVAVNVGVENLDGIRTHKRIQAEKITSQLTQEHLPELVAEVWKLRHSLESMPEQLYVQSVAMTQLVGECVQDAAMYFSTRSPRELGEFQWKIDAKSPTGETSQEVWWKTVLGPIFESNARRHQFVILDDPGSDYSHFDRAYTLEKDLWRPGQERKRVSGYDVGKLIVKATEFLDSKSDILLQAVDILANRQRRCFQAQSFTDKEAGNLGRLQLIRMRGGRQQAVKIISLTEHEQSESKKLLSRLQLIDESAREMFPRSFYSASSLSSKS